MKKYFIECGPPTPNGGLHLGHMAGTYIAADVFNRAQQVNGNKTFFPCYLDINQSFVRYAAINAGITREDLLRKNVDSIRDTFANYDIGFDSFNVYQIEDRTKFIIHFADKLLKSKYVTEKVIEFYYDETSKKFLIEAFISGTCSKCSNPVKGGTCEICGYYNFSININTPFSTINKDAVISKKACKIHVLETAALHIELIDTLNRINIDDGIRKFIAEIMANFNHEFPITLPLEDGIDLGFNGLKLNPWVEVLGGTYYLKHLAKSALHFTDNQEVSHICFVGIDNTFCYTIIHNLIRLSLGLSDFPENYFINRFYLINNAKFSTSKKNAIWADEVLQGFDVNLLRLFLATTHPDRESYNFSMEQLVNFKNELGNNNWTNKIYTLLEQNLTNTQELEHVNAKSNAKLLLDIFNGKNTSNNIHGLVQVMCPSLFRKAMRRIRKIPHIVKETSNSFKREYGVELNRLIALDEYKFGSSVVNVKPGRQTIPHSHDTLDELFYIIQGQGLLTLEGQESLVSQGDYIYIPAGMMHTLKHTGESELKFITIAWYI